MAKVRKIERMTAKETIAELRRYLRQNRIPPWPDGYYHFLRKPNGWLEPLPPPVAGDAEDENYPLSRGD